MDKEDNRKLLAKIGNLEVQIAEYQQIVQELSEKIKMYDPKYNFKTWLISIAKNNYSDYLKKKKLLFNEVNSQKIENIVYELNPEQDLINKQSYENLNVKIDELKPMYRDIIKFRYLEDLSIQEISKNLNQPVNTIKIKIFRAKKLLSEKLKSE